MSTSSMLMQIDHIFIFSTTKGKEADHLMNFGLKEGSSRVHPGQGTVNRKFYFENFFLEVLWVDNESELSSGPAKTTGLPERSQFQQNGYSRFGLCIVNTPETTGIFKDSSSYQPDYFPGGMTIDILANTASPALPWTFRLPFTGVKKVPSEPVNHNVSLQKLTKAEFGISQSVMTNSFIKSFQTSEQISFKLSDQPRLTLEFDDSHQGKTFDCPALSLQLKY